MCTSFRLTATDGTVVVGRTMEFPNAMGTKVTVIPRGTAGVGTGPDGEPGATWTTEHGVVGMDAFGNPATLTDGMNEAGLYGGLLYMPGFCEYTPLDGAEPSTLMAAVDVVSHVLGTCGDVAEAREALAAATVWPSVFGPFGFAPPTHFTFHDASGDTVVCEWRDGHMELLDNPIGVMTNWPRLDWHLTNLRNYINLSRQNPSPISIDGVELSAMGQGPGMLGLPGDSSSPARFVRAAAYGASLRPVATGAELEKTALHLLNNFDIPFGMIREDDDPANDDHTLWSSIANLAARRYAVRTYDNPVPLVVDLSTTDFSPGPARQVDVPAGTFAELRV